MSLMKHSISWFLVGTLASVGAAFNAGAAVAQSTELDPLEGLNTDDDGDAPDPFDLIHRAVFAPSMNADEFQEQQQEAISTEAEAFRLRQQQLIRQQQELEADVLIDEAIDDAAEAEAL